MSDASKRAFATAREMGEAIANQFIAPGDPEAEKQSKELAVLDLEAITSLKANKEFTGYYMRRLGTKVAALERELKRGEMTHEAREIVRQKLILLEDMMGLHLADERQCKRYLQTDSGPNGLAE